MAAPVLQRWWQGLDRPGWRSFTVALGALAVALCLALYSGAAAQTGRLWLAGASALAALGLAGWVAITIVPALARRTALRWLAYQIDYRLTREGLFYIGIVFVLVLAALNTGNNLLFLILACLLGGILVSGVISRIALSGVELRLELPEHVFAGQPILAALELRNEKQWLPSFSLAAGGTANSARPILARPVYFPYIPRRSAARQRVELTFPQRGVYRQDSFALSTRFPFGFLEKIRRVNLEMELVVYPQVEPTEEFYEILPLLTGERASLCRGRGHDLYSIRDYRPTDSARFVDWKASAKTGALKVREFTREDERRVALVFDPFPRFSGPDNPREQLEARFERAVTLCACLAWHFYEINALAQVRIGRRATPMAPAGEIIYDALRDLAFVTPEPASSDGRFLMDLAGDADLFKIILTSQPRGSIPTSLWSSSYFIFFDSL